jgi:hypothetical protein
MSNRFFSFILLSCFLLCSGMGTNPEKAKLLSKHSEQKLTLVQTFMKEKAVTTLKLDQAPETTTATPTVETARTAPAPALTVATTPATTTTKADEPRTAATPQDAGIDRNAKSIVFLNSNYNKEDQTYFYKDNIVCTQNNCPFPNVCTDATVCRCAEGYANFHTETMDPNVYCTYLQKKQLVAFLLEFFVTLGIGHFYAGRILFGVLKLLVYLGPIIIGILMCCCGLALKPNENSSGCLGLMTLICSCAFCCAALAWQLADLIMFGLNNYKDGNGVPLLHW